MTLQVGPREPLINLITEREFSLHERKTMYKQVAEGMNYLHENGMIHCSLQGKSICATDQPVSMVL